MSTIRSAHGGGLVAGVLVAVALVVGAAACSSSGGGNPSLPTVPSRSTTTVGPTTTTSPPRTTTTSPPRTITTEARTTTSQATTTSAAATTVVPTTVPASEKRWPWLAIGLLGAVLALIAVAAVRHHTHQVGWWARLDRVLSDGRALVDLGRAGPAATDPTQQVAHWSALEQRAQALGSATAAVRSTSPDATAKAALDGLGQASDQYLASIRNARALRIGPPAPSTDQLGFADAEAGQRLAVVAGHLDQLNQLALPHRRATKA